MIERAIRSPCVTCNPVRAFLFFQSVGSVCVGVEG